MKRTSAPSDEIAELLVHVGRSSRGDDMRSTLTASQWTCLRFFARANRVSRTPSAFASFQATTRGTASQTIKMLESKGFLARYPSDQDRRSVRLEITERGLETLKADPLADMIVAIDGLEPQNCADFLATLSQLSEAIAERKGTHAFGTCGACTHYSRSIGGGYCACVAAVLDADDLGKLCVNFGSHSGPPRSAAPTNETTKGREQ